MSVSTLDKGVMRKHPLFWLPNLLTMLRLTMSVLIAWMIIKVALSYYGIIEDMLNM